MAAPPAPLDTVRSLVDTWYGRVATGDGEVGAADLELALAVREGRWAAPARHDDAGQPGDAAALARPDEVAGQLPLHAAFAGDGPQLQPGGPRGVRPLMATLLGAAVLAGRDRTWQRLKVCREPRCRAAFYDSSRNGSGVWCSMSACGAAAGQRAFVERRRARNASRGAP